jgi:hypothetical protein
MFDTWSTKIIEPLSVELKRFDLIIEGEIIRKLDLTLRVFSEFSGYKMTKKLRPHIKKWLTEERLCGRDHSDPRELDMYVHLVIAHATIEAITVPDSEKYITTLLNTPPDSLDCDIIDPILEKHELMTEDIHEEINLRELLHIEGTPEQKHQLMHLCEEYNDVFRREDVQNQTFSSSDTQQAPEVFSQFSK